MGLEQERRRVGREVAEPPDQGVAGGGALGPPLGGRKVRWLALVVGQFGVIAQFCGADQRGVRGGFRDEGAASRGEWSFLILALPFQRPYRCPTCVSQSRWPVSLAITSGASTNRTASPSPAAPSAQRIVFSAPGVPAPSGVWAAPP